MIAVIWPQNNEVSLGISKEKWDVLFPSFLPDTPQLCKLEAIAFYHLQMLPI